MTHPNESLSHLNGDAGVAQVGDNETRTFIEAVQLIEDAGWVVLRPEQVSRRAANRTGGVEVKSDMHRAASALLGTLWQTVYSGTQTFEENWVEMDRRFPQARWLQGELKSASLAAEAEPVALDVRRHYHTQIGKLLKLVSQDRLDEVQRAEFDEIDEDHSWDGLSCACGGGWLVGHASGCPEAHPSSPVSAEVTVTDEQIKAISRDMEVRNMIEHAGRGFMTGSIGDASEPEWAAKIIHTILGKVSALVALNGGRENG